MATGSTTPVSTIPTFNPAESAINYDVLVTEDDRPVDSIYSERQHWLLTTPLNESWKGPGEGSPFFCTTDVALFHTVNQPPDALLSIGVSPPQGDLSLKENRSYFMWKYGKPPDALAEVVSGTDCGELTTKFEAFARLGATYYIVWDPFLYISKQKLQCFTLVHGKYEPCQPWFPGLDLGLKIWPGVYQKTQATYLRWSDRNGILIPTGSELAERAQQRADQAQQRADHEQHRADQAQQRADHEQQRADMLAEKLRALGVDPNQP